MKPAQRQASSTFSCKRPQRGAIRAEVCSEVLFVDVSRFEDERFIRSSLPISQVQVVWLSRLLTGISTVTSLQLHETLRQSTASLYHNFQVDMATVILLLH